MWSVEGALWGFINSCVCVCIGFILQSLLLQLAMMPTQRLFLLNRQLRDRISVVTPSLHQFPRSKGTTSEPWLPSSLDLPRHSFTKGTGRKASGWSWEGCWFLLIRFYLKECGSSPVLSAFLNSLWDEEYLHLCFSPGKRWAFLWTEDKDCGEQSHTPDQCLITHQWEESRDPRHWAHSLKWKEQKIMSELKVALFFFIY